MKIQKLPLFAAVGLLSSITSAQGPPANYYNSVDTSSSASLRSTLHQVIDDHQRFPYTSGSTDTWDILEAAQEDPNNSNNIIDIYRNASFPKQGGGSGNYDREHTWPRSYGIPDDNSSNYTFTDCHMLMLCDKGYNGKRENKPFRNCSAGCTQEPTLNNNGQGGPSTGYPGNSNWRTGNFVTGTWEVWPGSRGDIARAMLYVDVRYEGGNHNVTGVSEPDLILTDDQGLIAMSNTGNNESVAYMGIRSILLQWHEEDPVDAFEQARNDVVFNFQGNRNPFVDHPEWVDCVFNGVCDSPPEIFCQAKLASPFCLPTIAFSGSASATSTDPFDISVSMVINNKAGLLFYGYGQANLPFQGGTLCVQPPLRRLPVMFSGGNPPPNDCSGSFNFDFNAHIQSGSDPFLAVGADIASQYWFRDPSDFNGFGSGLSDAVGFAVAP